jgi:AhpD family alkylhydroperoxidase
MAVNIPPLEPSQATGEALVLYQSLEKSLGKLPNLLKTLGHAPHVLESYLSFSHNLNQGTLGNKLIEQIALYVAELNACGYCISAHSHLGKHWGLNEQEALWTWQGKSSDCQTQAVLTFAGRIVAQRGKATSGDISLLQLAGFHPKQQVEILAVIGLNMLTNYLASAAGTENDFPPVERVGVPLNFSI